MHHDDILEQNTLCIERKLLALTQEHVGGFLSLSCDSISNYERGRRAPGLAAVLGFELVYGKTLAELYPGLARRVAEQMLPALQKISIAVEWDERADARSVREAIPAIGHRISSLIPEA